MLLLPSRAVTVTGKLEPAVTELCATTEKWVTGLNAKFAVIVPGPLIDAVVES